MGCVPSFVVGRTTHKVSDVSMTIASGKSTLTSRGSSHGNKLTHRDQIRVPLTEKEVFAITKSWKAISRDMINIGVTMFLRMFEERSDVKSMFEQFRSVEKQDLGSSQSLENHALLVMNALDEAIANMDDPDYLIDMLLQTGKSHRRFDDFSPDSFWAIEEPFVQAARESLGDRFTNHMDSIYRKTIRFVLEVLIFGLKNNIDDLDTQKPLPAFESQR